MKYEFNIDPKALYLFIDNLTEEKYEEYINSYDNFEFAYDDESRLTTSIF